MRIVDTIKDAMQADAASRAERIISELVVNIDQSNKHVVEDLIGLIHALAVNPDPHVDLSQVVDTAKLLLDELLKPIPHPNKELVDELLAIIVSSAKPKEVQVAQSAPSDNNAASAIKLLAGEIKEVVKKQTTLENTMHESETKASARIVALTEELGVQSQALKIAQAKLDEMSHAIDKFLGLYEVIINQYNPFIEHVDAKKPAAPSSVETQTQVAVPAQAQTQQQPVVVQASSHVLDQVTDLTGLIERVRSVPDQELTTHLPAISSFVLKIANDAALSQGILACTSSSQLAKLLIKKSLKMNMQS
jgi:hypothetical protein